MAGSGLLRLVSGIPIAAVVTFSLFMFMHAMIRAGDLDLNERTAPPQLDIVSSKQDTDVVLRGREPEQPDDVAKPPPPPEIEVEKAQAPEESLDSALGRLPDINPDDVGGDSFDIAVADREEQPLVRIEPVYPQTALRAGREGKCLMTFDINPDGSTSNVQAKCLTAEGRNGSVFVRAAERAVARWKYAPRIRDGEAVTRFNQRTELVFQIAD